ncbi:MAG: ABC transporter permease [Planctomycetes bacterium]|jgi:oligopeptide transport system permease protein|nr:ABC transporter permease [Planctomycetota bacterium]
MRGAASILGGGMLLLMGAAAVLAPLLATHDFAAQDLSAQYLPPGSSGHLLGTDLEGRDLLSRLLHGSRVSLLVALLATLVSVVIGVAFGLVSGYAGGRVDAWMMRMVDVLYALPFLFLVILVMTLFLGPRAGPGGRVAALLIVLGAVQWLTMARIVRGQVLSLRSRDFVLAARALGAGPVRILLRHILPNLSGIIAAYATLTVPRVILQEAFLSFLGLGVPEPYPSWGRLAAEGVRGITAVETHWWLVTFPSVAITLALLGFQLLGDGFVRCAGDRGGARGSSRGRRPAGRPRTGA